ncbi:MAG: PQQ-binding-like beta-propeller repeat protein [Bacteroidota bacterium]
MRGTIRPHLRVLARLGAFVVALSLGLLGCTSLDIDRPFVLQRATEAAPPPPLERSWRFDADAAFGPDAPIAFADGRVVMGTRDGKVIVFDARNGVREATGDFGDAIEGRVLTDGPMVFVPVAEGRNGLFGYDAVRNMQRWILREGPHLAGPLLAAGTLVAGAHDGTIRGLDPQTGDIRWSARPDTVAQIRAAPVNAGGLAVVADTEGMVRAYDPGTGAVRWSTEAGAPVYRTPAATPDLVIVPTTRGRLLALDSVTGEKRWSIQIEDIARWASPVIGETAVVAGATDGILRSIDPATGEVRWTHTFDGTISAAPLLAGPVVYVGTYGRRLAALDTETGDEVWSETLGGRVKAGLVTADGTLVVLAEPRFVYGYRPQVLASR